MTARIAYYTNESFFSRDNQSYVVAKVTEGEPGYQPYGMSRELGGARKLADELNAQLGLTEADVSDIVTSSMAAGRV